MSQFAVITLLSVTIVIFDIYFIFCTFTIILMSRENFGYKHVAMNGSRAKYSGLWRSYTQPPKTWKVWGRDWELKPPLWHMWCHI